MSRMFLLLMVMVWMSRSTAPTADRIHLPFPPSTAIAFFFSGYLLMIWVMAMWSRRLAHRIGAAYSSRSLTRYNWASFIARLIVPGWLAVGVYVLGWDQWVDHRFGRLGTWPWKQMHIELPQMLVGTLPALMTWMALVWAQYPTDRALREQNVLLDLDDDLPVREPPNLRRTLSAAFRLQVLFTLAPVLLILILRDLTTIAFRLHSPVDRHVNDNWVILPGALAVFVLAPLILKRVLRTEPLPDSPLRRRLEQMTRDAKLKYRDILLWHTDGTMGNAAVMGIISPVRYFMLSDLLLETMTDTQVEAVFAHELGHVVYRHIAWYGVFVIMILGFIAGPADLLLNQIQSWVEHYSQVHDTVALENLWNSMQGLVVVALGMSLFLLAFGYLSTRFERQADVYAARTMQKLGKKVVPVGSPDANLANETLATAEYVPTKSHVGEYGAGVFTSALHRVAAINNIPVAARNWTHGSIAHRMRYLHEISGDPAHTYRFDRIMNRLYATLLVALGTFGIWGAMHSANAPVDTSVEVREVNTGERR